MIRLKAKNWFTSGLFAGVLMTVSVPVIWAILSNVIAVVSVVIKLDLTFFRNLPIYASLGPLVEEGVRSLLIQKFRKIIDADIYIHKYCYILGLTFGITEMISKIYWRHVYERVSTLYDYSWMTIAVLNHIGLSVLFLTVLMRKNALLAFTLVVSVHYYYNFLIVTFT